VAALESHTPRSTPKASRDPRPARTRGRIVQALGELLRSGESVSVAAICTRGGVGRSTFYAHFGSVDDVAELVVDEVFAELGPRDARRRHEHELPGDVIAELATRDLLAALREKREFFLYVLAGPSTLRLREHVFAALATSVRDAVRAERPADDDATIRTASSFIAGGLVALLVDIVVHGDVDDERIVRLMVDLLPTWLARPQTSR